MKIILSFVKTDNIRDYLPRFFLISRKINFLFYEKFIFFPKNIWRYYYPLWKRIILGVIYYQTLMIIPVLIVSSYRSYFSEMENIYGSALYIYIYIYVCVCVCVCVRVAERNSYFCLVRKLIWPLWSSYIFTQWGWFILFSPDYFPWQHKNGESPPNYLFLRTFRSRTDVLSVRSHHSSRITTPWGKPSNLWTFESTILD